MERGACATSANASPVSKQQKKRKQTNYCRQKLPRQAGPEAKPRLADSTCYQTPSRRKAEIAAGKPQLASNRETLRIATKERLNRCMQGAMCKQQSNIASIRYPLVEASKALRSWPNQHRFVSGSRPDPQLVPIITTVAICLCSLLSVLSAPLFGLCIPSPYSLKALLSPLPFSDFVFPHLTLSKLYSLRSYFLTLYSLTLLSQSSTLSSPQRDTTTPPSPKVTTDLRFASTTPPIPATVETFETRRPEARP